MSIKKIEVICDWPLEEMPIAGNVHENPELLEERRGERARL